jgi:ribA/ribD-fused uncharacterized protein
MIEKSSMMKEIDSFKSDYFFLSNFYECIITYKGLTYFSSEAAYQAAKCYYAKDRSKFTELSAANAKKLGKEITIVSNWDIIKYYVMYEILLEKFKNYELKEKLLKTNTLELIEGNTWHDNDWGDCYCSKCQGIIGNNHLGKLLMYIRNIYQTEENLRLLNILNLYEILDFPINSNDILKIDEYNFKF